jgi:hypothetical protein
MPKGFEKEEKYFEIGEFPEMLDLALGIHNLLAGGREHRVLLNDIEVFDSLSIISSLWWALEVREEYSGQDQVRDLAFRKQGSV